MRERLIPAAAGRGEVMEQSGYHQLRRQLRRSPLLPVLQQLDLPDNFKAYVLAMATMAATHRGDQSRR